MRCLVLVVIYAAAGVGLLWAIINMVDAIIEYRLAVAVRDREATRTRADGAA